MIGLTTEATFRVKSALAEMISKHARFYPHVKETKEQIDGALYILHAASIMDTQEVARVRDVIKQVEEEALKIQHILKECNPYIMLSFLEKGSLY